MWIIVSHTLTHYLVMLFPRLPSRHTGVVCHSDSKREFTASWFHIITRQIDLAITTGLVTKNFIFRFESLVAFTTTRFQVQTQHELTSGIHR